MKLIRLNKTSLIQFCPGVQWFTMTPTVGLYELYFLNGYRYRPGSKSSSSLIMRQDVCFEINFSVSQFTDHHIAVYGGSCCVRAFICADKRRSVCKNGVSLPFPSFSSLPSHMGTPEIQLGVWGVLRTPPASQERDHQMLLWYTLRK